MRLKLYALQLVCGMVRRHKHVSVNEGGAQELEQLRGELRAIVRAQVHRRAICEKRALKEALAQFYCADLLCRHIMRKLKEAVSDNKNELMSRLG